MARPQTSYRADRRNSYRTRSGRLLVKLMNIPLGGYRYRGDTEWWNGASASANTYLPEPDRVLALDAMGERLRRKAYRAYAASASPFAGV